MVPDHNAQRLNENREKRILLGMLLSVAFYNM